jgi:hypothetical protein
MPTLPIILFVTATVSLFAIGLRASQLRQRFRRLNDDLERIDDLSPAVRAMGTIYCKAARERITTQEAQIRVFMQPIVSLVILISSLYMVLSERFTPQDKHWAFGTIGTLIGFWLKR